MATTTITFADNDQVTSAKLNEIVSGLSFTSGDINGTTLAITGGKLQLGTVTASNMGALSVPTAALQAGCVTAEKIGLGVVGSAQLANLAVGTQHINVGSVTWDKISSSIFATKANMESQLAQRVVTADQAKNSPSAVKAYGGFSITDTSRDIQANSYNIASLVRLTSTTTRVNLATNMSSINYFVVPSMKTTNTTLSCAANTYAATSFVISHPAEAAGLAINFTVFGLYA